MSWVKFNDFAGRQRPDGKALLRMLGRISRPYTLPSEEKGLQKNLATSGKCKAQRSKFDPITY